MSYAPLCTPEHNLTYSKTDKPHNRVNHHIQRLYDQPPKPGSKKITLGKNQLLALEYFIYTTENNQPFNAQTLKEKYKKLTIPSRTEIIDRLITHDFFKFNDLSQRYEIICQIRPSAEDTMKQTTKRVAANLKTSKTAKHTKTSADQTAATLMTEQPAEEETQPFDLEEAVESTPQEIKIALFITALNIRNINLKKQIIDLIRQNV